MRLFDQEPRPDSSPNHRPEAGQSIARAIALGGLLAGLALLLLAASALVPAADLTFLVLSALPVAIAVLELGYRRAAGVYLAASLASLAYPGLSLSFSFLFFFGLYPLVKAFAEQNWPRPFVLAGKLLISNLLILASVGLFLHEAILAQAASRGWWLIPALFGLLQLFILANDYILGRLIRFYLDRVPRPWH
jgi:hypothetical protein